jgi:lysophospholipase L1-like esterase
MIRKLTGLSLIAGALFLGACHEDGTLNPPDAPIGGAVMSRWVAMGNSITAGFQSAGILDSTQKQSYAYLIANAAGSNYYYQSLRYRGCAPPFTNNVTQTRYTLPGFPASTANTCDLATPAEHPWLSNTAVPGARMIEATNNFDSTGGVATSASNPLTGIILGGKTQADRMEEAQPTLVTVWLGNNDVLGSLTNAANPGNPLLVTPLAKFQAGTDALFARLEATGARVLVLGVANVTVIPYATSGQVIFCAKNPGVGGCPGTVGTSQLPALFTVNPNCAVASILVPWSKYVPMIGAAAGGSAQTLDCSVDTVVSTSAETGGMVTAVTQFNDYLMTQAAAHGFAYWDPNPTLQNLVNTGAIPLFPNLSGLATGGSVTFGNYISLDGVHPSALAHKLIADSVAANLNAAFGTTIPVPVAP